jgi:lipoate-protein ligase A
LSLRVIVDGPRDPQFNMAVDEAIARLRYTVGYDTLRLYMWLPSGVSIGRRQDARRSVRLEEVERLGFKLVRRPTGGAALLHPQDDEVTYSVVLSSNHPLYSMDVASSAARIAEGIAIAVRRLGLEAGVRGLGEPWSSSFCYINPGSSDVTIGGGKVSGSAQRRDWGVILQHGTLLLRYDHNLFSRVLLVDEGVEVRVTGLLELLEVKLGEVIEALIEGFMEALGYKDSHRDSLSKEELSLALELYREKYSRPEWNLEGVVVERWR